MLENPYAAARSARRAWASCRSTDPAPAVVNAIRHLGFDVRAIPATPETIREAACASR